MFVVSFFLYISAFLISCIAAWRYSLIDDRIGYKKRSLKVIFRRGDDIKFFYMFFIILPPVLIATFRGLNIGTDTNVYLEIYHDNKLYNLIEYLKIYGKNGHEYEIGYQQILHISYILRGGFNLVKFLSEFFIIFFVRRAFVAERLQRIYNFFQPAVLHCNLKKIKYNGTWAKVFCISLHRCIVKSEGSRNCGSGGRAI